MYDDRVLIEEIIALRGALARIEDGIAYEMARDVRIAPEDVGSIQVSDGAAEIARRALRGERMGRLTEEHARRIGGVRTAIEYDDPADAAFFANSLSRENR